MEDPVLELLDGFGVSVYRAVKFQACEGLFYAQLGWTVEVAAQ
jgi:hypothetical protein